MRLETAFNLCTISSRAISSFLSQNLILPQNKTILCSCFPLHHKVLHGWGRVSGEGARLRGWGWGGTAVPSFLGLVPSPAKGRALRQGGGCSAEAEARPPRVLPSHQGSPRAPLRSPESPACALPRSPGSPACASPRSPGSPACAPSRSPGSLRVHPLRSPGIQVCKPTDGLTIPRVHPAGTWDCSATPRRDAAQPTTPTPGLCALRERKEQLRGGRQGSPETARPPLPPAVPGQVQRLQQPSAPCLCRRMPPEPPHVSASAGRWWCLGWPGRSRKAPPAKDAGGEGKRAPQSLALRPHHGWQEATVCILHLSALLMRVMCVQGYGCHIPRTCKNIGVYTGPWMRPLLFQRACHHFVVGITGSMPFLTEGVFQEEVTISMNGLRNSSKEWRRFKLLLMSIQCMCRHPGVVTIRY